MTLGAGDWLEVGGISFPSQGSGPCPNVGGKGSPRPLTLTAFVDVCGDLHSRV